MRQRIRLRNKILSVGLFVALSPATSCATASAIALVSAAGFAGYAADRDAAHNRLVESGNGVLHVQLDKQTCTGRSAIAASVQMDGATVGSDWFAPGTTKDYTVPAGTHSFGLTTQGAGGVTLCWRALVPLGGDFTYRVVCT